MATGPEMMINALLKMFGINTPDLQKQLASAVQAVLSFDGRLKEVERLLQQLTNTGEKPHEHVKEIADGRHPVGNGQAGDGIGSVGQ